MPWMTVKIKTDQIFGNMKSIELQAKHKELNFQKQSVLLKFLSKTKKNKMNLWTEISQATMIFSDFKLNHWDKQLLFWKLNFLKSKVTILKKWINFHQISDKKLKGFKQHTTNLFNNWKTLNQIRLKLWEEGLRNLKEKKNKCKRNSKNTLNSLMVLTSISRFLIRKLYSRKKPHHQFMKFLIRHQLKQCIFSDILHISSLFLFIYCSMN